MARKKLTQPQDKGGLGFIDCKAHAQALLSKWFLKAFLERSIKWVLLFFTLLEVFIRKQ